MSEPSYAPVPHARMIHMPDFHAPWFVGGGVMPTFDLLPNFFFRTGFYDRLARPPLALHRRDVVRLPYADRSGEPRAHEIRPARLAEHVSDLQFRLHDLRPEGNLLLADPPRRFPAPVWPFAEQTLISHDGLPRAVGCRTGAFPVRCGEAKSGERPFSFRF